MDGAPKALDFRAVELSWRMVLEAASASKANPRTCRGADGGLPCFQLKEELVDAAEEVEILLPHEPAQQWTVARAPVPQFLDETVEVKLVSQGRVQQQKVDHAPVPQFLELHADVVRLVPQERNAAGRRAKCGGVYFTNFGAQ